MSTVGLDREAGCLQADGTGPVSACGSTWGYRFLEGPEEKRDTFEKVRGDNRRKDI